LLQSSLEEHSYNNQTAVWLIIAIPGLSDQGPHAAVFWGLLTFYKKSVYNVNVNLLSVTESIMGGPLVI